jgi:hypothetical protein
MKTLLTTLLVATLFAAFVVGMQKVFKNTLSIPVVYLPTDGLVYVEGGVDTSQSIIVAIRKPDGTWATSTEWSTILKDRFETTFVAPEWTPPYVDQTNITSR